MTTDTNIEPTHSNTELLKSHNDWKAERDELLARLADERQRNSDLQRHCNVLEGAAMEQAARGDVEFARWIYLHGILWDERLDATQGELEIETDISQRVNNAIAAWKAQEVTD
jgi:hypothetical protein